MKQLIFILSIFVFFGCHQTEQKNISKKIETNTKTEILTYQRDSIYDFLFEKDTILLNGRTDNYRRTISKTELNFLEKNYSELFTNEYLSPDILYNKINSTTNDTLFRHFESEAGQDYFYVLYGYLLGIRNGIDKYAAERKKLFDVFEIINSIHSKLNNGGTYFGHMSWRIYGYVEYAICDNNELSESKFDYSKQKELFIQSLKQSINDEIDLSENIEDKNKFKDELFEMISELNRKIDAYFYLVEARRFEYEHY